MAGTLTQTELIAEVTSALGNRVDAQITQQRITSSLNLAQQRVSRFYSFPELREDWECDAAITGALTVDKWLVLPEGVKVIHTFLLQDGGSSQKLIEKPWRSFDYNVPLPEFVAPDWPSYYTRFDLAAVMLFPVPIRGFHYFLRATMLPTPFPSPSVLLYDGSQVSDFTDKDDVLISLAAAYFLRTLGRHDLAAPWESEALGRLEEAKATAEDHPDMDYSPDVMGQGGTYSINMGGGEYWLNPFISGVETG